MGRAPKNPPREEDQCQPCPYIGWITFKASKGKKGCRNEMSTDRMCEGFEEGWLRKGGKDDFIGVEATNPFP